MSDDWFHELFINEVKNAGGGRIHSSLEQTDVEIKSMIEQNKAAISDALNSAKEYSDSKTYTAILPASGWVSRDNFCDITITVSNFDPNGMVPFIDLNTEGISDGMVMQTLSKAWSRTLKVEGSKNTVYVAMSTAPTVDIPIKIVLNR